MRNRLDQQLDELNNHLLEMSAMIDQSIENATQALIRQDVFAARSAIAADVQIDQKEREIESLCVKLLLQQQPVAKDLRFISAALKMITDMERIGDQAADISELVVFLAQETYIKELVHLPEMSRRAIQMVRTSLDAFVKKDLALVHEVMAMDDAVDALFVTIKDELIEHLRANASTGTQAIDLLMIAKYYERIGDHAENIAEWVEYALTGSHKGVCLT